MLITYLTWMQRMDGFKYHYVLSSFSLRYLSFMKKVLPVGQAHTRSSRYTRTRSLTQWGPWWLRNFRWGLTTTTTASSSYWRYQLTGHLRLFASLVPPLSSLPLSLSPLPPLLSTTIQSLRFFLGLSVSSCNLRTSLLVLCPPVCD